MIYTDRPFLSASTTSPLMRGPSTAGRMRSTLRLMKISADPVMGMHMLMCTIVQTGSDTDTRRGTAVIARWSGGQLNRSCTTKTLEEELE